MSFAILFHFFCAQHASEINLSIVRSLRLFCWITTLVVLFLVRCVLEFRCGWVGVVSVFQVEASACNTDTTPTQPHWKSNTHRTKNNTTNVVIQQNSRKLLTMDILMSEKCWICAAACNTDTTPTQPHRNTNTHRTKNNKTNVVIQQNSRTLLTMDILMSETCWSCAVACNTDTTPTQPHRNSNKHRTKNNTTNVVIQQNSRKFLTMDILMSETCWAGGHGSTLVKMLCYKSEGRWFDPSWWQWIFRWHKNFRSHYGPRVDSASNRNE